MRKSKIKQISLAVCLALMPLSIYAAGLGKLNMNSGLGEPLKAEVELLSVTPEELSTLAATIASEEAYAAQGITRLSIHNNIKVEIAKNADGSPILKLRSTQPISDPYLDVLVQVDWATGRLQREYTVLLDPPGYKQQAEAATPVTPPSVNISEVSDASVSNAPSKMVDTPQSSTKNTKKLKKPVVQAPAPVVTESAGKQELTTKRGDTLSSVAREMQVEGVSLDQMLVGLYENNQEAFSNGNMNHLKVGQIIKVPTKESLVSISQQDAKQSVKVHSVNWNAYRNNLAGAVAAAPVSAEVEQKQTASGKIATAEDKAAPVKAGPQDVVKLSAGEKDTAKGAKEASKAFDAKITALQEEATAREKSLKDAQGRTAALEKQIEDMQKLLALKSQSMAELQKNAEDAAKAKATEVKPEPKTEVAAVETKPAEPAVAVAPEVKKEAPTPPQAQPKPEVKPKQDVQPAPQAESGLLEGLMGSADLAVIGGASGIALLGAGWMFLRNKRRKDLDSFERGILTSGGLRANTVFGNTTGNASMSDTSFLTDFAQSADGSMIDTNDVDPIAEAEVYMAYGRDAQAEEILKDAISKEPKRYELHLKLLEMYAARKDISAFDAIAGELYTTLGSGDPTWAKVAELGAVMEPDNPLYDLSKSVASSATQKLGAVDFSDVAVTTNGDLDFSLDNEASKPVVEDANSVVMQSFATAQNVEQDVSFDLGTVDSVTSDLDVGNLESLTSDIDSQANSEDNKPEVASASDNSMDFNLGDFSAEEVSGEAKALSLAEDLPGLEMPDTFDGDLNHKTSDLSSDLSDEIKSTESQPTDFDMGLNFPLDSAENEVEQKIELTSNAIDDISFDLDLPEDSPSQSFAAEPEMTATEISFDLPESEKSVDSHVVASTQMDEFAANTFDLSSINLDLDGTETELVAESPATQAPVNKVSESPDVDIKLDLVAAYIDMDDKEGARELLEEVMKEGGIQQQSRAQQLLDSLA